MCCVQAEKAKCQAAEDACSRAQSEAKRCANQLAQVDTTLCALHAGITKRNALHAGMARCSALHAGMTQCKAQHAGYNASYNKTVFCALLAIQMLMHNKL